ncbi:PilZ domain-containing protein [Citromicrobium bathyomarinum]
MGHQAFIGSAPAHVAHPANDRHEVPRLERTVTLLMLGRLRHRGSDTICRIRNVSAGGMRIDTGSPLEKGDRVAIEARSGVCIDGQVAWTNQLAAGIAFTHNVDHQEMLSPPVGPSGKRLAARSPRFHATARARLQTAGEALTLRLVDISLGGCRVESDAGFPLGADGSLTIPGLPPLACTSRWATGNRAGLIFHVRPDFESFARWLEAPDLRFAAP